MGGFQKALVIVSVDSHELFRGILSTDNIEGFAGRVSLGNLVSCDSVQVQVGFDEDGKK